MKRAPFFTALTLLVLGLAACRRVSWQIVADPAPARSESEASSFEAPPAIECEPQRERGLKTDLLGKSATPSAVFVLEGHVVGTLRVRALPAIDEGL